MRLKLPKIDPELKRKWVEALRSGAYKQTAGSLAIDIGDGCRYCCLGVLGAICGVPLEKFKSAGNLSDSVIKLDHLLGSWGENYYDSSLKKTHNSVQKRLAGMNDTGKSFKYIASWIERYL